MVLEFTLNSHTQTRIMAFPYLATSALFFLLFITNAQLSTCNVLKGSVTCLDCSPHYELSGVRVAINCSNMKTLVATTLTNNNGHFEAEIPSAASSSNCFAHLLGGPVQLCAFKRNMVSEILMKAAEGVPKSYELSTPLTVFVTSCASRVKLADSDGSSSPSAGDPQPTPWDFLPHTDFFRIFPIIGIP